MMNWFACNFDAWCDGTIGEVSSTVNTNESYLARALIINSPWSIFHGQNVSCFVMVTSDQAERTLHCSECEAFETLISSVRPGAFFDLYFGTHVYDIRTVHQRISHTIAIF